MASIFGRIGVETPPFSLVQKHEGFEVRLYAKQIRAEVEVDHQGPMMRNLNSPFRMLAGFIFGNNTSRAAASKSEEVAMTAPVVMQQQQQQEGAPSGGKAEKVAMTAPVVMQRSGAEGKAEKVAMTAPVVMNQSGQPNKMKMSFIMPSKYTSIDALPVPKDSNVKLVEVPERKVAVVRFSGSLSDDNMRRHEEQLRAAATKAGLKLSQEPSDVQYAGYNPPWCLPWLKTNEVMVPVLDG